MRLPGFVPLRRQACSHKGLVSLLGLRKKAACWRPLCTWSGREDGQRPSWSLPFGHTRCARATKFVPDEFFELLLRFEPSPQGSTKKPPKGGFFVDGRGERIRTSDPCNPIAVRYQTAPRPDIFFNWPVFAGPGADFTSPGPLPRGAFADVADLDFSGFEAGSGTVPGGRHGQRDGSQRFRTCRTCSSSARTWRIICWLRLTSSRASSPSSICRAPPIV